MSLPLIMLVGQKGVGKDTIAQILTDEFSATQIALADPIKRYMLEKLEVSAELLWGPSELRETKLSSVNIDKAFTCWRSTTPVIELPQGYVRKALFNMEKKLYTSGITVREILQFLGDIGRESSPTHWADLALRDVLSLYNGKFSYSAAGGLISDSAKLPAPLVVISDGRYFNEITQVKRENGVIWQIQDHHKEVSSDKHSSEVQQTFLPMWLFDAVIENNKKNGPAVLNELVCSAFNTQFLSRSYFRMNYE